MKSQFGRVLERKEQNVMLQRTTGGFMLGVMLMTLLLLLSPHQVSSEVQGGGVTTLVSLADDESPGNEGSFSSAINGDGRYLLFTSKAANLVAGDTNLTKDVFLRDMLLGTTIRVSLSSSGAQANALSYAMALSANGRIAAFESDADNLVAGDTNGMRDIFVRDLASNATQRVSLSAGGNQLLGLVEFNDMSTDGRYVVFTSNDATVVPNDTNGAEDVFVRDRVAGTTVRVSVTAGGMQGNAESNEGSISDDGQYVAFNSGASNLVAGDTNGTWDAFIRNMVTNEMNRVLYNGSQIQNEVYGPIISGNGNYVVYASLDDLVSNDNNGYGDVYINNLQNNSTELISVGSGNAYGGYSFDISADGQTVAFLSTSPYLVACDSNRHCGWTGNESCPDMFLRDRVAGQTHLLSLSDLDKQAYYGVDTFYDYYDINDIISDDGNYVVFHSPNSLTAGDTNSYGDVFRREWGSMPPTLTCSAFIPAILDNYAYATPTACSTIDSEPNNRPSEAVAKPLLCPSAQLIGTSNRTNDGVDYFRIDVQQAGTIQIDLTNLPDNSDFDLYLYNGAGVQVDVANTSGSQNERIRFTPAQGYYFISVVPIVDDPTSSTYHLRWFAE